jgi:hypothetical protein
MFTGELMPTVSTAMQGKTINRAEYSPLIPLIRQQLYQSRWVNGLSRGIPTLMTKTKL